LEAAEALEGLPRIAEAAAAYFAIAHPVAELPELPAHRCPTGWDPTAPVSAGPTPVITLNCWNTPEGLCLPGFPGDAGPGYYPVEAWTENTLWQALGFSKMEPHRFHYQFVGTNAAEGYGACRFTALAFGNLDDDYPLLSTYRVTGTLDETTRTVSAVEWSYPCR
jgi:type IV pilus assembly protein PilA